MMGTLYMNTLKRRVCEVVEIWKMIDNNQERVNLLNNYFASVV